MITRYHSFISVASKFNEKEAGVIAGDVNEHAGGNAEDYVD